MSNRNGLIICAQEGPGTGCAMYVVSKGGNGYVPRVVHQLSLGGGSYRNAIPKTKTGPLIRNRLLTPKEIESFENEEGVEIYA